MKKQTALTEIKKFEKWLPYGAKAKIARALRENKHNIQAVFRGLAGESLTIKVYNKAKKLYPDETTIKSRSNTSAKAKSL